MKLPLIAVTLAIVAMPLYAHAQGAKPAQGAPKATKAAAQKVVQVISADKAKTKTYCDISALTEQLDKAEEKKDKKMIDELSKKAEDMSKQLGPEYAALMDGMQSIKPDSKEGEEIGSVLDGLDKLCAKK